MATNDGETDDGESHEHRESPPAREIHVVVPISQALWDEMREMVQYRLRMRAELGDDHPYPDRDDHLIAWDVWNERIQLQPEPEVDGEPKLVPDLLEDNE